MKITELKLRHKIIPYIILILMVNQLISPRKGWMILLVALSAAFGISYAWAVSLQKNLELSREMRFGWSQVGDHLQERFNLKNGGWAPAIWLHLNDHSDLAGYSGSRITRIGSKAHRRWFERGICERRGLYTIGPTDIYTSDPLGIYEVIIKYSATTNMMVMPPIVSLPEIQIAPGGKIGEGINITKSWDHTVTASGVREYQPGESLRYIHWPTSARRNELFVRTFDSTPTSDQWIFMDMNANIHAGDGEDASEEHGIILAASLMNWSLENGHAVGLGANGKQLSWYRPKLDETQKWAILRGLALLEKGADPLLRLLEVARQSIRFRSSIIIITADLSGEWLNPVLLMRKKGIIPTILLLNAPAFGGDGNITLAQNKLDLLGLNNYRIDPDYLDNVEVQLSPATQKRREEFKEARKVHWRPLI
jgi:uncharacterized protein (DUF58 family)